MSKLKQHYQPRTTVHPIVTIDEQGEETEIELVFRPVAYTKVLPMRKLAKELSHAWASVGAARELATGRSETTIEFDSENEYPTRRHDLAEPPSVEAARQSVQFKTEAVEEVIGVLLDDENREIALDLLASSLRGPKGGEPEATREDLEEADVELLVQLFVGFIQAHMESIAPFMARTPMPAEEPDETTEPDAN